MNTLELYRSTALDASRATTYRYSTSFSMGVRALHRRFRDPIHSIYGFVRFADEIVDTFQQYDKRALLERYARDTWHAIDHGISLNPILHAFQHTVNLHGIDRSSIGSFLDSMAMDLDRQHHDRSTFTAYVHGSAEAVGLMCLRVFCEGDEQRYRDLGPAAMRLGAAFQKVNFLRDLKDDHTNLGRNYFPEWSGPDIDTRGRTMIGNEIMTDFDAAYAGIRGLPRGARLGVYVAYRYYKALFQRIMHLPMDRVQHERVSVPGSVKATLFMKGFVRHNLDLL